MAIKVNGTTVIDDSRNLSNVGGMKTVNGNSLIGSGDISVGVPTTGNTVGSYCFAYYNQFDTTFYFATRASSTLYLASQTSSTTSLLTPLGTGLSGTWRAMGYVPQYGACTWVRIS